MTPAPAPIVRPEEAETITRKERREVVILAAHPEVAITWSRYAAGERGPDLHVHREHTDAFYVLDGELTFGVGPQGDPVRVAAGGFVAVPPNVAHSFRNDGPGEARWLNLHAPDAGFAEYMRGLRDGTGARFDSFDPPPHGGLPAREAIVCGPGEGERLQTVGRGVLVKGALPDMCFVEWALDGPYDGPEQHRHERQVDSYYVLEGELDVTLVDATHVVGQGTLASVPSGVRHTFGHTRPGRGRVLNVHTPDGGFADVLRRMAS